MEFVRSHEELAPYDLPFRGLNRNTSSQDYTHNASPRTGRNKARNSSRSASVKRWNLKQAERQIIAARLPA
jgi:hypothetical protein